MSESWTVVYEKVTSSLSTETMLMLLVRVWGRLVNTE